MSERRLFGLFSGAQVTAMVCAALIAPGVVYAASYTYVVLTDPVTGHQALVDPTRRLSVYDPIAGYSNDPANLVVLAGNCTPNATKNIFTVPAGKALILKTLHMAYADGTANFKNYVYFIDNNSGIYISQFYDLTAVQTFQSDFGSGFYIHAGDGFSCQSSVTASFTTYGYYVPSTAVPAN